MEGRDGFTGQGWLYQHYLASRGTGYKEEVHAGEKKRGYRALAAENDLTDGQHSVIAWLLPRPGPRS